MKRLIFVTIVCAFMAGPVLADLTPVYNTTYNVNPYYEWDLVSGLPDLPGAPSPGGGSPGAGDILDSLYGSWTRIDDDVDQVWQDLDGGMKVQAKYTSVTAFTLGYSLNELTGVGFVNTGLNLVGETALINVVPNSDLFIWGASGAGVTKWSNEALNGGQDRMVTFRIDTLLGGAAPSQPTYVIGFEDGTDWDYQDLVVEITNCAPVPVPAAVLLGILGLGVAGLKLRKFA